MAAKQQNTGGEFIQSKFSPLNIPGLLWWMDAGSLNSAGTSWIDKTDNGYDATISGTAWTTTTVSGFGSTAAIPVVYGLSTSQALWPAGSIPSTYTFIHVARYANYADHAKSGRIWTSTSGGAENWLSGFWYGSGSTGVSGVAYHNNWTVSPQNNLHSDNWVLSTDQPSLYRSNGVTRGTGAFSTYPNGTGQLKINYSGFELSDFHIAEAIMFNRVLTAAEYQLVEQYLSEKYGISIGVTTPNKALQDLYPDNVTLLARFDGTSGSSTWTDYSNCRWVGSTVPSGTYTPTLTSGQLIKGDASVDFSSNNNSAPSTAYAAVQFYGSTQTSDTQPQYLDVSKDFTVEGWVYFNGSLPTSGDIYFITSDSPNTWAYSASMNGFRVGKRSDHTLIWYFDNGTDVGGPTSGAGAVKFSAANTWYHWAVTKTGTTMRTYINGTASTTTASVGTRTHSQAFNYFRIGTDVQKQGGSMYLDDIRVTNGIARYSSSNFIVDRSSYWPVPSDPYWTSVVNYNEWRSNLNDSSQYQRTWTHSGTPSYYGYFFGTDKGTGRGMELTGSNDYVTTTSSSDFAFGTGDFTVEFWCSAQSSGSVLDMRDSSTDNNALNIYINASNYYVYRTGSTDRITGTVSHVSAGWRHVAVSRVNGTTRLFVNGVLQGSAWTDSTDYQTKGITLGVFNYSKTSGNITAAYECLRVTKGIGRYSAAFTPPTAPFPAQ